MNNIQNSINLVLRSHELRIREILETRGYVHQNTLRAIYLDLVDYGVPKRNTYPIVNNWLRDVRLDIAG